MGTPHNERAARARAEVLTVERLREVLDYDPLTGRFRWRVSRGRVRAGSLAGFISPRGYIQILVDYRAYLAHRLAWLHQRGEWPTKSIDHINGKKDDNRWLNLREASVTQNNWNCPKSRRNRSGYKGVAFTGDVRRRKPWAASICANGQKKLIGRFSTAEEAHQAYAEAARKYHGEFSRTE